MFFSLSILIYQMNNNTLIIILNTLYYRGWRWLYRNVKWWEYMVFYRPTLLIRMFKLSDACITYMPNLLTSRNTYTSARSRFQTLGVIFMSYCHLSLVFSFLSCDELQSEWLTIIMFCYTRINFCCGVLLTINIYSSPGLAMYFSNCNSTARIVQY